MKPLEIKKIQSELLRVQSAKAEMEYIIAQRLDEIERLETNIKNQEATEKLLKDKLENKEGT